LPRHSRRPRPTQRSRRREHRRHRRSTPGPILSFLLFLASAVSGPVFEQPIKASSEIFSCFRTVLNKCGYRLPPWPIACLSRHSKSSARPSASREFYLLTTLRPPAPPTGSIAETYGQVAERAANNLFANRWNFGCSQYLSE